MGRIKENPLYQMIRDFLTDYLPVKRNCSPNTVRAYRTSLDQLLSYIQEQKQVKLLEISFKDLSGEMIHAYLDHVEMDKHCSIKTRNHRLNCLRAFFCYAALTDLTYVPYYSDICKIPFKKTEKAEIIEYLNESAIKSLLEQPDVSTLKGVRNQFIMVLMYDTAARIQEIVDLRVCDFKLDSTPQVRIHGKGNKYRSVPLMEGTVLHYRHYLQLFHKNEPLSSDRPLFYTVRKGICNPISDDMIRVFMNRYAGQAHLLNPDVPEKIHPHLFRHSRAMHLYQHGMDLTLISQWLGHADITTTLMYAHADTEMKRRAIEQATAQYYPEAFQGSSPYDINDDDVLRRLYGLK
ncbi:MAG: tyrosine-type recombinase/integrase [Lachnospiraceae bacterium]|nr:tyrosine-type recombinase/integrase [Lachnospiraceae bacterium]